MIIDKDFARLCYELSINFETVGDLSNALSYMNNALESINDEWFRGLCISKLGDLNLKTGSHEKALTYYNNYHDFANKREHFDVSLQDLENYASYFYKIGDYEKAIEHHNSYLQFIKVRLQSQKVDDIYLHKLAIANNEIGYIYYLQGKYIEAEQHYSYCQSYLSDYNKHKEVAINTRLILYSNFGDLYISQNRIKEAKYYYDKYHELSTLSVQSKPKEIKYREHNGLSYSKLSIVFQHEGNYNESLEYNIKCNEVFKELYETSKHSVSIGLNLAVSYGSIFDNYVNLNNIREAECNLSLSNSILKELNEISPKDELVSYSLVNSYQRLCAINREYNNNSKALEYCKEFFLLVKNKVKSNPSSEFMQTMLALSYSEYGDIYFNTDKYKLSLKSYNGYNEIISHLYDKNPSNRNLKENLAYSNKKLGNVCWELGKYLGAYKYINIALDIFKELLNENLLDTRIKNSLAETYEKAGHAFDFFYMHWKARIYFIEAAKHYNELYEKSSRKDYNTNSIRNKQNSLIFTKIILFPLMLIAKIIITCRNLGRMVRKEEK